MSYGAGSSVEVREIVPVTNHSIWLGGQEVPIRSLNIWLDGQEIPLSIESGSSPPTTSTYGLGSQVIVRDMDEDPLYLEGYSLVLNDNFDTLDTDLWYRYENSYGAGNNEIAWLSGDNVSVSDSILRIEARRESKSGFDFTSGFVSTRSNYASASPSPSGPTYFPRFGRFEMRGRVPHGQGLWPAFWLRHRNGATATNGAEIDIMEIFHAETPGHTRATTWQRVGGTNTKVVTVNSPLEAPTYTPGWHVWAVDILPAGGNNVQYIYYLDGNVIVQGTVDGSAYINEFSGDGYRIWDVSLNCAIGGNYTGHPDDPLGYSRWLNACLIGGTPPNSCSITRWGYTAQRAGAPGETATLPQHYDIDYFRMWEYIGT
jgi:hypothetical protein